MANVASTNSPMASASQRLNCAICRSSGVVLACTWANSVLMRPSSLFVPVATTVPKAVPAATSVPE